MDRDREPSLCVFCLKSVVRSTDYGEKLKLVDKEVKVIFIVRNILGVPQNTCIELLKSFGDPSTWIKVCWACHDLISEAKSVHDRINQLEKSLQVFKDDAKKKMEESQARRKEEAKRMKGATGKVRDAVLKIGGSADVGERTPGGRSRRGRKSGPIQNDAEDETVVKQEVSVEFETDFDGGFDDTQDSFFNENDEDEDDGGEMSMDGFSTGMGEEVTQDVPDSDDEGDDHDGDLGKDEEVEDGDEDWVPDSPKRKRGGSSASPASKKRKRPRLTYKPNKDDDGIETDESGVIKVHRCHLCKFSNIRKTALAHHIRKTHVKVSDESKQIGSGGPCEVCKQEFETAADLIEHKLVEHQMFKCARCPTNLFDSETSLKDHIRNTHVSGEKRNVKSEEGSGPDCEEKILPDTDQGPGGDPEEEVEAILKEVESELMEFKCSRCQFVTHRVCDFNRHKREVHWDFDDGYIKKRKCKLCKKTFPDMAVFREHCIKAHQMVQCEMCPKVFKYYGQLRVHMEKNHDNAVPNNETKSKFKLPKKRRWVGVSHNVRIHEAWKLRAKAKPTKDLKCDKCDFKCKSEDDLDLHVRKKHWVIPKVPFPVDMMVPCECTVCEEEFEGGEALRDHCVEVHHMGYCDECNKLFAGDFRLETHRKKMHTVRTQPKSFKCSHCPKLFHEESFLKSHQRVIHWVYLGGGGGKPKNCRTCGQSFEEIKSFRKHCIEAHNWLQCKYCPKISEKQGPLDSHIALNHTDTEEAKMIRKNARRPKPVKVDDPEMDEIIQCEYCTYHTTKGNIMMYHNHMADVHYEIDARDKMARGEKVNLKCMKCLMTSFETVDDLIQHQKEAHRMVKCEKCLHMLLSVGYLQRHEAKYHDEETKSHWMNLITERKKRHLAWRSNKPRGDDRKFTCKFCNEDFENREELKNHHLGDHPDKMFQCDKEFYNCEERFESLKELYAHKVKVHNEPSHPYKCLKCDYTAKRAVLIERHRKAVHEVRAKVICEICSNEYSTEKYLDWHKIKDHGLGKEKDMKFKMLQCKQCSQVFSSPYYLAAHIRNRHEGKWRYKCSQCKYGFHGQKQLEYHVKCVHEKDLPFPCKVEGCGKRYGTSQKLNEHILRSHGERKMKCRFCDYETNDKNWLTCHENVHMNEQTRPYQCDYCGKGFPAFRYLQQHFRCHIRTGEMDKSEVPSYTQYKIKLNLVQQDETNDDNNSRSNHD